MTQAGSNSTVPRAIRKDWPTRVLVADDDPVSQRIVETFLTNWGYNVLSAADGVEAWRMLESPDAPRLALLDWTLPGLDGVAICRKVREQSGHPYTYILLLAASGQKQDLLAALHAGADDYLTKPADAAELSARLYVGRRILAAQDELIAAREALRFQATHDPLTGLWNHGELLLILQREFARANRTRQPLGLLMMDLDHFKQVNDQFGHLVGDEVLVEISRRLLGSVRAYDVVGRCGGEEFMILVPGIDPPAARVLAERIVTHIRDRSFETSAGSIGITASLGAAFSLPAHPLGPIDLIRAADVALYRAKQNGRNRAEISSPEILSMEKQPEVVGPARSEDATETRRG